MADKVYLEWENVDFKWNELDMVWEEVILKEVASIIRRTGGASAYVEGNPWDVTRRELGEEKTKKFVEIVCTINDLDFKKVYETKELKVTVDHIQKTFIERLKVEIKI